MLENFKNAFYEMERDPVLISLSIGIILASAGAFSTGIFVQKHSSAGLRSVMVISRIPLVWIASLSLGW